MELLLKFGQRLAMFVLILVIGCKPDPDVIEVLFKEVKNSLIEFTINPNSLDHQPEPNEKKKDLPNLDDW